MSLLGRRLLAAVKFLRSAILSLAPTAASDQLSLVFFLAFSEHVFELLSLFTVLVALPLLLAGTLDCVWFCVRIHHARDLLRELEKVYAVFRVATDDLITTNMAQIIAEDLLREQIDQRLNIHGHFFFVVGLLK